MRNQKWRKVRWLVKVTTVLTWGPGLEPRNSDSNLTDRSACHLWLPSPRWAHWACGSKEQDFWSSSGTLWGPLLCSFPLSVKPTSSVALSGRLPLWVVLQAEAQPRWCSLFSLRFFPGSLHFNMVASDIKTGLRNHSNWSNPLRPLLFITLLISLSQQDMAVPYDCSLLLACHNAWCCF